MPTALDIAKWFTGAVDRESGDSVTHLKLQKLVYYAQAWSLALRNEELFEEDLQAWAHGPVAESVYRHYEGSSWNALPPPEELPVLDDAVEAHLTQIIEAYGGLAAKQLEAMTHAELPWLEARDGLPPEARSNNRISKATMASYYRELYESTDAEEESAQ